MKIERPEELVNLVVGAKRFSDAPIGTMEPAALALLLKDCKEGDLEATFTYLVSLTVEAAKSSGKQVQMFDVETTVASIVAGTIWRYPVSSFMTGVPFMNFRERLLTSGYKEAHSQKWIRGVVVGLLIPWRLMIIGAPKEDVYFGGDIPGYVPSDLFFNQQCGQIAKMFADLFRNKTEMGDKDFSGRFSTLIADSIKHSNIFNCHLGPQILREWLLMGQRNKETSPFGMEFLSQVTHKSWSFMPMESRVRIALEKLFP